MTNTFMPSLKTNEGLQNHQLKGLQWTVAHACEGSSFYRQRLEQAGVGSDDIQSLDDIHKLPFTTADDLRVGYPFPLLAVPDSEVVRIHASSGTTGKRKILTYTQKDIDDWVHFFARCYEMAGLTPADRVQIAVGYGVWTAGVGFQLGCEKFGAMALPVGPGNVDMQCQFLVDLQTTVMCCTASMGLLMAEEVNRRKLKDQIKLKKMIFGSERSSDAMRARIKELLDLDDMFDITGMTELYGPGTGLDCHRHEGIHYWADYYILECLDPESLEPVPPGEVGEMVITTLCKEAAPLIRYRTRDLTRMIDHPCSCGSVLPMHDRILGRSDDMIIFRAVNIYPGQIDEVLSPIALECCDGYDPSHKPGLAATVQAEVKKKIMVSCDVDIVDYCSLPRSERKSKRFFDNRPE